MTTNAKKLKQEAWDEYCKIVDPAIAAYTVKLQEIKKIEVEEYLAKTEVGMSESNAYDVTTSGHTESCGYWITKDCNCGLRERDDTYARRSESGYTEYGIKTHAECTEDWEPLSVGAAYALGYQRGMDFRYDFDVVALRKLIALEVKEYLELHNLNISATLVADFIKEGR